MTAGGACEPIFATRVPKNDDWHVPELHLEASEAELPWQVHETLPRFDLGTYLRLQAHHGVRGARSDTSAQKDQNSLLVQRHGPGNSGPHLAARQRRTTQVAIFPRSPSPNVTKQLLQVRSTLKSLLPCNRTSSVAQMRRVEKGSLLPSREPRTRCGPSDPAGFQTAFGTATGATSSRRGQATFLKLHEQAWK